MNGNVNFGNLSNIAKKFIPRHEVVCVKWNGNIFFIFPSHDTCQRFSGLGDVYVYAMFNWNDFQERRKPSFNLIPSRNRHTDCSQVRFVLYNNRKF